ncbi:hypothetical protein [Candidatus Cyanaurora vandensis]|uniref:hypothetical protein n=1 Tax=Candidatus Cyanaurora vandensis TaxID=2714958 RepID=UPI00257F7571|nr:hypothetical protein [Candidatus Cyanaurora vandensis]
MLKLIVLIILGFWATPCLALPTPTQVTAALYQQIPDFPKGGVNQDGTQNLIRRLVTYHNFLKNRSPYSRFDWKLTVADYIGYNDPDPG